MRGNDERPTLADIIRDYSPRLRSYIHGMVGNREDTEDILQDVFYQLVRTSREEASDIEKISAWLYRVAKNAVLNLRRKKRECSLPYSDDDDEAFADFADMLFSDGAYGPENTYLRKLVWQELEEALSELPEEQREIFCLTVFDGIPVKAISESTGVSTATLLSRKHYAVKHLRMRLRGLYEDILSF